MKKKNIFISILFIIFLSIFNTLYKYIIVTESLTEFNSASFFGSAFATTSKVKPPYIKIFLLSLICILFIYFLLVFTLYFINKKEVKKITILDKISNFLPLIISIIISSCLLFINKIFSFIILFIGLIIYLCFTYKKINDKKSFITILIFVNLGIYLLYLISS